MNEKNNQRAKELMLSSFFPPEDTDCGYSAMELFQFSQSPDVFEDAINDGQDISHTLIICGDKQEESLLCLHCDIELNVKKGKDFREYKKGHFFSRIGSELIGFCPAHFGTLIYLDENRLINKK